MDFIDALQINQIHSIRKEIAEIRKQSKGSRLADIDRKSDGEIVNIRLEAIEAALLSLAVGRQEMADADDWTDEERAECFRRVTGVDKRIEELERCKSIRQAARRRRARAAD